MVDALDSKSSIRFGCVGSSPSSGTMINKGFRSNVHFGLNLFNGHSQSRGPFGDRDRFAIVESLSFHDRVSLAQDELDTANLVLNGGLRYWLLLRAVL